MKRRTFLIGSLTVGAAAGSAWFINSRRVTPGVLAKLLRAEMPLDNDLLEVGNRVLETLPGASVESLTTSILQQAKASSSSTLAEAIRNAVHEDFKTGQTVELDGWVLSPTELNICGLRLLLETH